MLFDISCRWIAFDAVGTLIQADPPVAEAYHRIGQAHGSRLTFSEVQRRFGDVFQRRSHADALQTSEVAEYKFWRSVISDVLSDVSDCESCFLELHDWFARPTSWRCFPDVGPALQTVQNRGIQVALASNFDARLHTVCDGLPELREITTRVVSSEVGWRKPHGEFYAALIDACGGNPAEILMVGDHRENDVRGAELAGLRAVLIDRDHVGEAPSVKPRTIRSLAALLS